MTMSNYSSTIFREFILIEFPWHLCQKSNVFFCLLYFFPPPFKDNGLLFWVPDVLCRHSEVVLWNLLRVQMFFWRIWGGESGLPDLFLCHLRTASPTLFLWDLFMLLHVAVIYCFSLLRSIHCVNIPQSTCCTIDKHLNYV